MAGWWCGGHGVGYSQVCGLYCGVSAGLHGGQPWVGVIYYLQQTCPAQRPADHPELSRGLGKNSSRGEGVVLLLIVPPKMF